MKSSWEAGQIARAIALQNGIRAVPTDNEWSYNLKTKELRYARYNPWAGVSYQYWYAILMHEIAHAMYTTDVPLPTDKRHEAWHLLHNYFEDNYIERRLELQYPQGYQYKRLLRQCATDIVMEGSWRWQTDLAEVPLWKQYLMLIMIHSAGMPGDVEQFMAAIDPKVAAVYEETKAYLDQEDFASTQETVQYMLDHFESYKTLITEDDKESRSGNVIVAAVNIGTQRGRDLMRQLAGPGTKVPEVHEVDELTEGTPVFGRSIFRGTHDAEVDRRVPNVDKYQQYVTEMRLPARNLRRAIEPYLREVRARRRVSRQRSGLTNTKRLWEAAIPRVRVFERQLEDVRTDHYAVTVAIDESGSMQAGPLDQTAFEVAQRAAVMIIEACRQMQLPTRVVRFNHAHWECTHGWGVDKSKEEQGMVGSECWGGDNNDIEALTAFVKKARSDAVSTGRKHLHFQIGDGLGEQEMNEAARRLQRQYGVEIYGLVINNHSQGNEDQYPHAKLVKRTEDLPGVMSDLLRRYLGRRIL